MCVNVGESVSVCTRTCVYTCLYMSACTQLSAPRSALRTQVCPWATQWSEDRTQWERRLVRKLREGASCGRRLQILASAVTMSSVKFETKSLH